MSQDEDVNIGFAKSTLSGGGGCVEVARMDDTVLVRDSKDRDGPILAFAGREWDAFLARVRAGEYDRT